MIPQNPLLARFQAVADADPGAVFLAGREQLTYGAALAEVASRAERLAAARGRPVVLHGPNSGEWVLGFLGAQAAGLLVVLLPQQGAAGPLENVQRLLGSVYVYDASCAGGVLLGAGEGAPIPRGAALCQPTSGSTGSPRYALRSASSLLSEGRRYVELLGLSQHDRILASLPLCHSFSLGAALAGAIAAGGSLRLEPKFVPRRVLLALAEEPVSVLPLVPSAARLLCTVPGEGAYFTPHLRHLIVGAGAVSDSLEQLIVERLGRRAARNYGSTETGATLGTAGEESPAGATGRPLSGVETALADDGTGRGALFVRTADQFLGYLGEEGFDGSRVSPDGWFSTGDLAAREEGGWIRILGRLGQGLRRGGRSIQPVEVEQALAGHPDVAEAVVTGGVDAHGEDVIEVHVELRSGARATVPELRGYLEGRLEANKIPTSWQLYDALPRTDGGKPDRGRLRHGERGEGLGVFTALAMHRLSAAVAAAHRLGILDSLARDPGGAEQIALRLGLEPRETATLLALLSAAGLLSRDVEGRLRLVEPSLPPGLDDLVQLEEDLRSRILVADRLERIVRGEAAADAESDLSPAFSTLYGKVMAPPARRSALLAWRRLALPEGRIVDIGRPGGAFASVAAERLPSRSAEVFDLPLGPLPEIGLSGEPAAAIFLHNVFRYLCDPAGGTFSLETLCASLHRDGMLIVSDIFIDSPSSPRWLRPALSLDWAAFGSTAWPGGEDLCAELGKLGFDFIERHRSDPLFDLVIARRTEKAKG